MGQLHDVCHHFLDKSERSHADLLAGSDASAVNVYRDRNLAPKPLACSPPHRRCREGGWQAGARKPVRSKGAALWRVGSIGSFTANQLPSLTTFDCHYGQEKLLVEPNLTFLVQLTALT